MGRERLADLVQTEPLARGSGDRSKSSQRTPAAPKDREGDRRAGDVTAACGPEPRLGSSAGLAERRLRALAGSLRMGNRAAAISEYEVAMRLDESIGKPLGALLDEDERDHQG
jgi:hypothetical protein